MIYEAWIDDGYEWVNACDPEDYEVFWRFNGEPLSGSWRPIPVRRVPADARSAFRPADFPWLGGHALVMRRTAVDALRDLLERDGEVLPLSTRDEVDLYVLNARVIDAMDKARSVVVMIAGTSRIQYIEHLVLVRSAVEGADVFRLPHRASATYVSERFVERVHRAGLVGLVFNKVCESDG